MTSFPAARILPKKKITQRTFEIEINQSIENHLRYFIQQELGYYNALIEQMAPRLRAFPHEILAMKDREKKQWEVCAEHAVDPHKLISHKSDQWPEKLRSSYSLFVDQDGVHKVTPSQLTILKVAATPARLHSSVRKNIASEILKALINQAETMHAGQKTDAFRAPIQTLQSQTFDTKRHLQIPKSLVKIEYQNETDLTNIHVPYAKDPLVVVGYDLTEIPFQMLVVRAPHPRGDHRRWYVDFRDSPGYMINLTDHHDRRSK